MDLVVVQVFDLPAAMAHALQIVRSADALARRGHAVELFPRVAGGGAGAGGPAGAGGTGRVAECLRQVLGRDPAPGLAAKPLLARGKLLGGLEIRARLLARLRGSGEGTCFYARQRRLALWILRAREKLGSRARVVYEFHNLEHVLREEAGRPADARAVLAEERAIARMADGLVAISRPLAEDVGKVLAPRAPVLCAPDGVDLAEFGGLADPLTDPERARLVYAGSLYAHKGVEALVAMMRELAPEVSLAIVGGRPPEELERLRRLAAEIDPRGTRIVIAGEVAPAEVPRRLAGADVVLLPSSRESRSQRYTSPLKLFEAMASGVPIVAAPTPAAASVLVDGETAYLAASGEPADLARAVKRVLADRARARAIGHAAAAAAADYSWERRAERIESFLAGLSQGGPPRSGAPRSQGK